MSTKMTGQNLTRSFEINNPKDIKIACVVSEWHYEITENLLSGVKEKLLSFGLLEKKVLKLLFQAKNLILLMKDLLFVNAAMRIYLVVQLNMILDVVGQVFMIKYLLNLLKNKKITLME